MADGATIDKIYHPYVEQLEWEAEWRMVQANKKPSSTEKRHQLHKLGIGNAVSETIFIEGYLIAEQSADESLTIKAYELEALWQLSEQGEFYMDYGILFEIEKADKYNAWEYGTTLLLEKEIGQFSATANLGLIYEWGNDIDNEWETSFALQTRYRYSPRFEPGLELYAGEDTRGAGPVIMGIERISLRKALRWELGAIFGLDNNTADYTLRAVVEFEF